MRHFEEETGNGSFDSQSLVRILRSASAVLGLITIIIGLVYATRVFGLVFGALTEPESIQAHLEGWALAVGGDQLDLNINGTVYHSANGIAISALGGCIVILAWLSLGLVQVGAKTVAWTLGDSAAVKRVLRGAFGRTGKKDTGKAN